MNKLKVIIADDEEESIELLRNILTDTQKVEIVQEICEPLFIESAINKHNPDLLILDIEMPGINGLSILENIREYNQKLNVVYITAFEKYTTEAIKLNVFSYLLKPVDRIEINCIIDKLIDIKEKEEISPNKKIKLPIKGGSVYIKPNDLFLLEAEGNYTRLRTIQDDEFISSYNMGRLFEKLPNDTFFRINRSCVLNGEYIYKINKNRNICHVRLNGEEMEFEVSKAFITDFNRTSS